MDRLILAVLLVTILACQLPSFPLTHILSACQSLFCVLMAWSVQQPATAVILVSLPAATAAAWPRAMEEGAEGQ